MTRAIIGAVAIFLLVMLGGFATVLRVDRNELDDSEATVERLKQTYVWRTQATLNLDYYRQQFRDANQVVARLVEILPSSFDSSLAAMEHVAEEAGLRVEKLDPDPRERLREFYAERTVRIEASGGYHDLGEFLARLSSIPGIVRLETFAIEPSTSPKRVVLKGALRTYRYLEDEEVIAMRRKAGERSQ